MKLLRDFDGTVATSQAVSIFIARSLKQLGGREIIGVSPVKSERKCEFHKDAVADLALTFRTQSYLHFTKYINSDYLRYTLHQQVDDLMDYLLDISKPEDPVINPVVNTDDDLPF